MSVWNTYANGPKPPAGTPDIAISWQPDTGHHHVYADGRLVYVAEQGYYPAHRWCQNTYRLTSTMMLPVYTAYQMDLRAKEAEQPEECEPELQQETEQCPQPLPPAAGRQPPDPGLPGSGVPPASASRPPNKYRKPGR